ncbi:MAG: hypothetical protein ACREA8_10250 [Nitrosotalea sp.]
MRTNQPLPRSVLQEKIIEKSRDIEYAREEMTDLILADWGKQIKSSHERWIQEKLGELDILLKEYNSLEKT